MDNYSNINKNNKGISLIEIVIVVAILTIIGSVFVLSTSVATDKHITSCAEMLSSSLEQTRSLALGRKNASIKIWQETSGDVIKVQMIVDNANYGNEVAIGREGTTVTVTEGFGLSATTYDLSTKGLTGVTVSFSRSNGSVIGSPTYSSFEITNGHRKMLVNLDKFSGRVETIRVN